MLSGYKTYVVAALIALAAIAKYLQVIDSNTADTLLMLLGATGTATLAAKVNKVDKKLLLFLPLFLVLGNVVSAQTPLYLAWDYPDAEIGNVVSFQTKVDGGSFADVGIPNPTLESDTPAGNHTFKWLLPAGLSNGGNHTVSVRACNAVECSFEPSLVFKLIGPPTNLRIKK